MFEERSGDLLECKGHIAHCVAIDMEMGAGVALQIRKKYLSNNRIKDFIEMNPQLGDCFPEPIDSGYLFNMVTKPSSRRSRPTKENFKLAIETLFQMMKSRGISRINIPRLGCGLDRLSWEGFVKPILCEKAELGFEIIVWVI